MTQIAETLWSIWDSALLPPEGTNELRFFNTKEADRQTDGWCEWFLKEFGDKLDKTDREYIENKCIIETPSHVKSFEAMEVTIDGFTKKTLGMSVPLYYQLEYGICTEADKEPTYPISTKQLRKLLVVSEWDAEKEVPLRTAMINLTVDSQVHLHASALKALGHSYYFAMGAEVERKGILMLPDKEYTTKLLWAKRVPFDPVEFEGRHVFTRVYFTGIFRKDDDKGKK